MNKNVICSANHVSISYSHSDNSNVFSNVNLDIKGGTVFGIYGKNGTGKSTLLKILSFILTPTSGYVELKLDETLITRDSIQKHIGFVSPSLSLYDEFTLIELVETVTKMRGILFDELYFNNLLELLSLSHRRESIVKGFSSGMLQRVKLILATIHKPSFLFLDEPTTNLDDEGIMSVHAIIQKTVNYGGLVCIATNENREKNWCTQQIDISSFN